MRRRSFGVLAAVTMTLAASGCGDDDSASSDDSTTDDIQAGGTLTIWADDKRAAALQSFAEQFGEEYGITVTVEAISNELAATFLTASQQGNGPDVIVTAHDGIGNFVQNGAIDPVQLSNSQKEQFAEVAVKGVTYNDQIYGVPYAIESVALIRNTDLVPSAPTSIEEMVSTGQSLVSSGQTSEIMALQCGDTGDFYHIFPLYSSGGGTLFGTKSNGDYDPTQLGLAEASAVTAFEKIAALGEAGSGALKRSIGSDNATPTFTAGNAPYLVSGAWALNEIQTAGINYEVTAIPPFSGGAEATPFVGVQAFFVASKGANKVAAQEFVTNYVSRDDLAKALYEADPRPPALTSVLEDVSATDPDAQAFMDIAATGVILPAIPAMATVWDPLGKAEAAIIGGAEVASTVEAAATTVQEMINQ